MVLSSSPNYPFGGSTLFREPSRAEPGWVGMKVMRQQRSTSMRVLDLEVESKPSREVSDRALSRGYLCSNRRTPVPLTVAAGWSLHGVDDGAIGRKSNARGCGER